MRFLAQRLGACAALVAVAPFVFLVACGGGGSDGALPGDGGSGEGGQLLDAGFPGDPDGGAPEPDLGPELEGWIDGPALPQSPHEIAGAIAGDRMYVFSGDMAESPAYVSRIGPDGAPGPWREIPGLPRYRYQPTAAAWGDHVYVAGGYVGDDEDGRDVLVATASADGELGEWRSTSPIPKRVQRASLVAYGGRLYLTGGWDQGTNGYKDVHVADVLEDGALSPWRALTPMPNVDFGHAAVVHGGWLYVVGGRQRALWRAHVQEDGTLGSWISEGSLGRETVGLATQGSRLYVVGGATTTRLYDDIVWTSPLQTMDGGKMTFTPVASKLPEGRAGHLSFARDGMLYVVGGYGGAPGSVVSVGSSVIHARFRR